MKKEKKKIKEITIAARQDYRHSPSIGAGCCYGSLIAICSYHPYARSRRSWESGKCASPSTLQGKHPQTSPPQAGIAGVCYIYLSKEKVYVIFLFLSTSFFYLDQDYIVIKKYRNSEHFMKNADIFWKTRTNFEEREEFLKFSAFLKMQTNLKILIFFLKLVNLRK